MGRDAVVIRLEEGSTAGPPQPLAASKVRARCDGVNGVQLGLPMGWPGAEEGLTPKHWWHHAVHVVAETFLLARLALRLWGYLGFGWRWICSLLQLLAYTACLLPGFLQMIPFYFFSPRVIRGVRYGTNSRNDADIYVPPNHWGAGERVLRPIVLYVTGGAWTIGHKAWGALLARRLSKAGVIVCCLDYRNFPQGAAMEMLEDINAGIGWALQRAVHFGGDPDQVFLCGQSCGAHLTSLALLTQVEQRATGQALPGGSPSWDPSCLRAYMAVSGVFNVHDCADHLHRRGLYRSLLDQIMSVEGQPQLKLLSPSYLAAHVLAGGCTQPRQQQHSSPHGAAGAEPREGGRKESGLLSAAAASSGKQPWWQRRQPAPLPGRFPAVRARSAPPVPGSLPPPGHLLHEDPAAAAAVGEWWEAPPALQGAAAAAAPPAPAQLLPPVVLLHGSRDRCAPVEFAEQFAAALRHAGVDCRLRLFEGDTHTTPLLENPMRGGKDELLSEMLAVITGQPSSVSFAPLCPAPMVRLATAVCPF